MRTHPLEDSIAAIGRALLVTTESEPCSRRIVQDTRVPPPAEWGFVSTRTEIQDVWSYPVQSINCFLVADRVCFWVILRQRHDETSHGNNYALRLALARPNQLCTRVEVYQVRVVHYRHYS